MNGSGLGDFKTTRGGESASLQLFLSTGACHPSPRLKRKEYEAKRSSCPETEMMAYQVVTTKKTGRKEGRWGRFLPARGRKIYFSLDILVVYHSNTI